MISENQENVKDYNRYTLLSNKQFLFYLLGTFVSATIGFFTSAVQHLLYTIKIICFESYDIIEKEMFINRCDIALLFIFCLFTVLAYNASKKEKIVELLDKKDEKIRDLEVTVKNSGMSLYKYMSRLINESINNVLQELATAVTENVDSVISVSISKYSVTYSDSNVEYDIVHEAAYSRHNIRAMYIGREIYKLDKLILSELKDLLSQSKSLNNQIDKLIDDEVLKLEKEYEAEGKKSLSRNEFEHIVISKINTVKFGYEHDAILERMKGKVEELKFILEHRLQKYNEFQCWVPRVEEELTYNECSLRIIINAYLTILKSYSNNPINEDLDKFLRRKQRTSIMTSILIGESSYDVHQGVSDKNGRIYVFYPFEFNLGKYIASFSLTHESLGKDEHLNDPAILQKLSDDVISNFDKYLSKIANEYSLQVTSNVNVD